MIIPEDSPRKDDILKQLKNSLSFHIEKYYHCFQNETFDGHELGEAYIRGLFKTESGKRNMEPNIGDRPRYSSKRQARVAQK
jgi:hypothetical protein